MGRSRIGIHRLGVVRRGRRWWLLLSGLGRHTSCIVGSGIVGVNVRLANVLSCRGDGSAGLGNYVDLAVPNCA
jgi:hypothetical protein